MIAKTALLASAFLFAAAPSPPAQVAVPSYQILAAVACLLAEEEKDFCQVPAETGSLGDQSIRTIGAIDGDGNTYHYFIADDGRFGVTVMNPEGKLVILVDANLDGKIESTSVAFANGGAGMAPIEENDPDYPDYQNIYMVAMAFMDQIAPNSLLDAARPSPDG